MEEQIMVFATVLCPIVTALVELVKRTFPNLSKRAVPLLSVVVGLLIGAAAVPFTDMDLVFRLWSGGFAGIAATGLFEIQKGMRKNRKYVA